MNIFSNIKGGESHEKEWRKKYITNQTFVTLDRLTKNTKPYK